MPRKNKKGGKTAPRSLGPKILELRGQGKTYPEIEKELGCSRGTISYHCGKGQKAKTKKRRQKRMARHPWMRKIQGFQEAVYVAPKPFKKYTHPLQKRLYYKVCTFHRLKPKGAKLNFDEKDVEKRYGTNPDCYLTGDKIDREDTRSYHYDHVVPLSKGGTNELDNLGICTREANQMKSDLTLEELTVMNRKMLRHNLVKLKDTDPEEYNKQLQWFQDIVKEFT